jgi:tetratricopeptide (TPR) repeat protein
LNSSTGGQPDDPQQIKRIWELKNVGAVNQALREATLFLKNNPNSAEGHLLMAIVQKEKDGRRLPASVRQHAEKALSLGLPDKYTQALAYLILGEYLLHRERVAEAIHQLSLGLDTVSKQEKPILEAKLLYQRAVAQRRQRRYEMAYEDIENAIRLAGAAGFEQHVSHYQMEREVIQRHAGRPLGPTPAGV